MHFFTSALFALLFCWKKKNQIFRKKSANEVVDQRSNTHLIKAWIFDSLVIEKLHELKGSLQISLRNCALAIGVPHKGLGFRNIGCQRLVPAIGQQSYVRSYFKMRLHVLELVTE